MLHIKTLAASVVIGLVLPSQAVAWGKTGHRVTGEIAQAYLSEGAREEISHLLGVEDLAEASTWPDFMRSSRDQFWTKEAGPYHYVTIPKGETYESVGAPEKGDAIAALEKFKAVLQGEAASQEEKQLALRFTVHIIGDLHQPLHAGNGTDKGGNDFKMTFFWEQTNLHRVWDSQLIEQEELSYTEMSRWLSRKITQEDVRAWTVTDPIVWAEESASIRDEIYPEGDREEAWGYVYENRDIVRRRLSQGGVRIAAYLNEVFD
ncbi:S1/P1 nuclease [Litorimonas haliclonae]|uniref:S1/P1 nuclease n=1 Tax=Litorimonas haliclonae TaxID=2081977 RepID=UPI0039EF151C